MSNEAALEESELVEVIKPIAAGGTAQAATAARDLALDFVQTVNDRFYYCSTSDDEDQTPELAKIGKQPRRPPGGAEAQSRRTGIAAGP